MCLAVVVGVISGKVASVEFVPVVCEHCPVGSVPVAEMWRFSVQAELRRAGGEFEPVVNVDLADVPGGLLKLLTLCTPCAYELAAALDVEPAAAGAAA